MRCRICETRKPRRYCPGVRGDICAQCCGTEREVTVDCPLECEYLRQAREHERRPEVNPDEFPNRDVRVTEQFLEDHQQLLYFTAHRMVEAALGTPGAVDSDVREAIESLVRTYRTLESGLIYETRPGNPVAGAIHQHLCSQLQEYRERLTERTGMTTLRDSEILGVLVFLERLAIQHNNGRRRGRAFIDYLRSFFPTEAVPASSAAPLIQA